LPPIESRPVLKTSLVGPRDRCNPKDRLALTWDCPLAGLRKLKPGTFSAPCSGIQFRLRGTLLKLFVTCPRCFRRAITPMNLKSLGRMARDERTRVSACRGVTMRWLSHLPLGPRLGQPGAPGTGAPFPSGCPRAVRTAWRYRDCVAASIAARAGLAV